MIYTTRHQKLQPSNCRLCPVAITSLMLAAAAQAQPATVPPVPPGQPGQVGGPVDGEEGESSFSGEWTELASRPLTLTFAGYQEGGAARPAVAGASSIAQSSAGGGSTNEDLAKKLANPIADLISVPLQSNFSFGGGPENGGFRYLLNIQPVIPITLNEDWNVISRTILPVIAQDDLFGADSQAGLGDTLQSLFFSPRSTEPFIWGLGPVALLPTSTDDYLGAGRWGLGPTGVILKQAGPWTVGCLANHIWGFQRDDGRNNVNATYLQPFLAYTFPTATTLTLNLESTYDWNERQWTVPAFAGVGQLVRIGTQPVNLKLGAQYWMDGPQSTPEWGIRFEITFLFPR